MSSAPKPISVKSAVDTIGPKSASEKISPDGCRRGTVGVEPSIVIEPRTRWTSLGLRELWAYRELLYFLTWRDVKVRYKQTILGGAWAILQPFLSMVAFTLFFGKLARVPSDGIPYPIFAYAGLLPWTFFANSVNKSGASLVGNASLITKVYFPRMIIPAAAVGAALVDFAVASAMLIAMMAYYRVAIGVGALMFVPLVVCTAILALAVGTWTSALNVKYRDVGYVLPFVIQLWMFATPIIYPASLVPGRWRWLIWLNPLGGLIEGFRSALFHRQFNWPALAAGATITLASFFYAAYSFRRTEPEFADII